MSGVTHHIFNIYPLQTSPPSLRTLNEDFIILGFEVNPVFPHFISFILKWLYYSERAGLRLHKPRVFVYILGSVTLVGSRAEMA